MVFAVFTNCLNCLGSNQISGRFRCKPPSLEVNDLLLAASVELLKVHLFL